MMRPLAGARSYQRIVPRFESLVRSRMINYYLRGTYTHYNLDFSEDVLHLADLGFTSLSVEPVVAFPQADYAFQKKIYPFYFRNMKDWWIFLDRKKSGVLSIFHFTLSWSKSLACLKVDRMGAGLNTWLLPRQEISILVTSLLVGNLPAGGCGKGLLTELSRTFQEAHIYHKRNAATAGPGFIAAGMSCQC